MINHPAGPKPLRARRLLIAGLTFVAIGAAVFASRHGREPVLDRSSGERPALMLLTSLPILFGEKFGLEGHGSPALSALEKDYEIRPINAADATSLGGGGLLLMAQPLAQPAETLVELDKWVRGGGRLLLLADPFLEWRSERPLGDKLRPPTTFADTGLLKHWGLTLYLPEERGPKQLSIGRFEVLTASPGSLEGACAVATDRLVAHCRIGKGMATVIADADFLNVADLDGPTQHNLDALLAELKRLESSESQGTGRSTDLSTAAKG